MTINEEVIASVCAVVVVLVAFTIGAVVDDLRKRRDGRK